MSALFRSCEEDGTCLSLMNREIHDVVLDLGKDAIKQVGGGILFYRIPELPCQGEGRSM
jgi:hypothetical protein